MGCSCYACRITDLAVLNSADVESPPVVAKADRNEDIVSLKVSGCCVRVGVAWGVAVEMFGRDLGLGTGLKRLDNDTFAKIMYIRFRNSVSILHVLAPPPFILCYPGDPVQPSLLRQGLHQPGLGGHLRQSSGSGGQRSASLPIPRQHAGEEMVPPCRGARALPGVWFRSMHNSKFDTSNLQKFPMYEPVDSCRYV